MSIYRFSLHEDSVSPGGMMHILTGGANRAIFCLQGSAGTEAGEVIAHQQAICTAGGTRLTTGHDGCLLWRWELALSEDADDVESAGVTSRVLASVEIDLEDGLNYQIRVESLGLPPKDRVLHQTQIGHVLNVCMQGSFLLTDNDDDESKKEQTEAWFTGKGETYSLKADETEPSLLVRAALIGPDEEPIAVSVPGDKDAPENKRFDKVLAEGVAAL